MYCPKCGAQNPDDTKFCSGCGSQLGTGVVVMSEKAPIYYGGFWRRFVAVIIDSGILTICGIIIGAIVGGIIGAILGVSETALGTMKVIIYIIIIIFQWFYFACLESSLKQATLGKMVMGIIVTDLNGNRISFGKASGRYWGKIVSAIILMIGFIMAGFTQRKQALHDIMAGTLVVKRQQLGG